MAIQREAKIAAAKDVVDYPFKNTELLWEALQAAGSDMMSIYPEGNKRLAMIGDVALKMVILLDMRGNDPRRGSGSPRASMSNTVSQVGSNPNLDRVSRSKGLEAHVNPNRSQQGIISTMTLTATFEAILGAVYLDSGYDMDAVRKVMRTLGLWDHPAN